MARPIKSTRSSAKLVPQASPEAFLWWLVNHKKIQLHRTRPVGRIMLRS